MERPQQQAGQPRNQINISGKKSEMEEEILPRSLSENAATQTLPRSPIGAIPSSGTMPSKEVEHRKRPSFETASRPLSGMASGADESALNNTRTQAAGAKSGEDVEPKRKKSKYKSFFDYDELAYCDSEATHLRSLRP